MQPEPYFAEISAFARLRPRSGKCITLLPGEQFRSLRTDQSGTVVQLSGDLVLRFSAAHVQFGQDQHLDDPPPLLVAECRKNIEMEPCTVDFVRSIALGKSITSAGDFGRYLEVGLDQRFNLGLHVMGFHLIATENPIEDHRL